MTTRNSPAGKHGAAARRRLDPDIVDRIVVSLLVGGAPALAAISWPAYAGPRVASRDACAAVRAGIAQTGAGAPSAAAPGAKPSADSAEVLAKLKAQGAANGSAAPNAEAQALLDAMAGMMAGRGDADSQAAAQMIGQAAGKPGATGADAMKAALGQLGC